MRLMILLTAMVLTACGGASEPAETFVLGEPQYKQPNVKEATRAYKAAFKLAQTYEHAPREEVDIEEVLSNRRAAIEHAEATLRAPGMGTRNKEHQQRYYKGIRSVNLEDCQWSRISEGGRANYLYGLHGLTEERGWLCRSTIVLKFCPRCDRDEVDSVLLFVEREQEWFFAGGREHDDKYGICLLYTSPSPRDS